MTRLTRLMLCACAPLLAFPSQGIAQAPAPASASALIPVESFTLPNGLKVVFHVDRSDPVVAVALNAHVGSAREQPGRTGFAHMFEHLFFLESENLGKGGLDKMSARIGGAGANGSTNRDMTDYFQTVPNDALEKMIWAEADKLGYFINTVTEPVLAKEKQVVKNEKRQAVDNQPYGHTGAVVAEALYPADHPYSWEVIGSLADLDAATLEDVKGFYRRWYTPGNVTLVIAGDFDPKQARAWVEKYFAEIPAGTKAAPMTPRPANLAASKSLFHEDNLAQLPELTMVWPTVPALHPDYFAIDVLADLLADGKEAPLNAVLVDQRKVTSEVSAAQNAGKVAGELWLSVRAFEGTDLDQVKAALDEGLAKFEREGVDPRALARVKTQQEVSVYGQIGSVLGKANRIARYDLYAGNPGFADREIAGIRAVTAADVMRVYQRYVKGRPFVATSFVPKGKAPLALAAATRAKVVEEAIVQGAEAEVDPGAAATYARTPSSFDRSVEPPYGGKPEVKLPAVWQAALANGLELSGIRDNELPTAVFELAIDGGRRVDDPKRPGAASLLARMMTRGTARRTPAELEDALKSLGADIEVEARDEQFVFTGRTLARNFAATIDLLEEMLLEPRWDTAELALAKAAAASDIQAERAEPESLADRAFEAITYGPDHVYARSALGTERSVAAMTMDDLKRYHAGWLVPNNGRFRVVGAVEEGEVRRTLADLGSRWARRVAALPNFTAPRLPAASKVYFYDLPGAKQSVFAFGYPGPKRADEAYYPAAVTNYILGGGGFASRLTQELREGKGYTYGISSGFSGGAHDGTFRIDSGVRSNVTLEAAALTRDVLSNYPKTFSAADLAVTQGFLTKSRARALETQAQKLAYLGNIGDYGLAVDYPRREQAVVDGMTVARIRALAAEHIRPNAMTYVIVGDAKTQASRLTALGFGEPVMINETLARLEQ
jgi:zinc protease